MILHAEIQPLDTVAGTRKTVRATNANIASETALNDEIWRPAISEVSTLSIRLFKGDFDGTAAAAGGNLGIEVDQLVAIEANVRRFAWQGAPITIWAGELGAAWGSRTKVFEGLVGDTPGAEGNRVTLPLRVKTEPFDADILTARYAGTGGAAGGEDLKDQLKPLALGWPRNVEPVLIDVANSVYQFSAYGPIEAVTNLYERGSAFAAAIADYGSYALLVAADIQPGEWATCLAEGMVRLGAPAYGVITGDIKGHAVTGTAPRLTGDIIALVASLASVDPALIDTASLDALDTAAPYPISVMLTDQESVLDFAVRLAAPCNAQAGISLLGKLFVARIAIASPSLVLDAQQRQMPRVTSSVESGVSPPFSLVQMGYAKAWKVHTADEISFNARINPRGRYDDLATYREGDMINLADGSEWIYINAEPSAGNPPPDWPTTSNTWWENATPPSDILSAQVAIRTAAIRNPRDGSDVPRDLLIATESGGSASISVARHDWDYPNGNADITRALGTVTGLSPATSYYVYFDDATLADTNPTYATTTVQADGENSTDHPYRHPLGKITTPAIGAGPTTGGPVPGYGYQVLVESAGDIATNFNARNDRIATAVVAPTVAGDGTCVDHAVNDNGSVDISFEWLWGGTEAEIDGFEVMLYTSTSASAYTPGTSPAAEQVWIVPANKRALIIYGVQPTAYHTFAVRAFRVVDPDIDIDQRMNSAWVKSTLAGENPYRPSASTAFAGNITGTVNGTAATTVSTAVANFNSRNDRNGAAITQSTWNTDGTAVDHTDNGDGSGDISVEWNWAGSNNDIDGWEVMVYSSTSSALYTPGTSPSSELIYLIPPDKRAFIMYGVTLNLYYSFAVRAFRYVDQDVAAGGRIYTTWRGPQLSSEYPYRPASSIAFAGNITGTVNGTAASSVSAAVTNFNGRNDRNSAAIVAATIPTDGSAVDHTTNTDGSCDISFEWNWSGSNNDIDGWDVMVYASTSSSAYTPGSNPAAETIFRFSPDKRAFFLFGANPTLYYTFAVRAFRTVDQDIAAGGFILGSFVKPSLGAENPYRPSSTASFAGDLSGTVNGTAASTVASGALAANSGLNADGTLKTGKLSTAAAVANQALVAAGYTEQGGTIVVGSGGSFGAQMIASLTLAGARTVVEFEYVWQAQIINPVQGTEYSFSLKGWMERISSGLDTYSNDWTESVIWERPSATGTFLTERRVVRRTFIFNAPPAAAHAFGYVFTVPASFTLILVPYRYMKANDLRALE